jgi:hypothetical protein
MVFTAFFHLQVIEVMPHHVERSEITIQLALQTAIQYLLSHFDALTRYCEDGRLPISNIRCEHVAKTIAIARKNFMFCDIPQGASASARIYSTLETAKANGHHPREYLTVQLTELPLAEAVEDYEAMLPWNMTPDQLKEKMASYQRCIMAVNPLL